MATTPQQSNRRTQSTLYPLHPKDSKVLIRFPEQSLSYIDRCVVALSSILVVGAAAWVPALYVYLYRKWNQIPKIQRRKRTIYGILIFASLSILIWKPHASLRGIGTWLREWKLWDSWMRYLALEVIADDSSTMTYRTNGAPTIYAISPHGIFPFGLAFAALPKVVSDAAFGVFRPVVATATNYLPIVSDFLLWLNKVDASKTAVDAALANGARLGLVPGGIAEIFEGYPKRGTRPDSEYVIVRQGVLKLAMKHGVPVVPVYCFGSTKLLHRISASFLERLSSTLRASVVFFYGSLGLPIPFRQKLSYVVGRPILPPSSERNDTVGIAVESMMDEFCHELQRIFERHKEAYGWGHKTLELIRR